VVLRGGAPIGRLWMNRADPDLRIVDVSLSSSRGGEGIRSRLVQRLVDEAAVQG
jgi:hypothetical protein